MSCTVWTFPPYLPTSYFYNYSPDGCDDTRVHGYISLGGGLLGLALLFLALGGRMRGVILDWIGVWTTTIYNLCCLWIMMNGPEHA